MIKEKRKEKKYTQEQMSQILGISLRNILGLIMKKICQDVMF